ncbi:MAG: methylase, partial [Pacificimonas sp.]
MQTALALDTPPLSTSILDVAATLADLLDGKGQSITRQILTEIFANETGCSDASGHWSMRDAYTALELAQVLVVCGWKDMVDVGVPSKIKTKDDFGPLILDLFERLPSQSYRSESQIELQQFSTPLPLAWAAAGAAGITADDIVLEPSAGTGLLALRAHYMGAKLILNEIDELRRDCLAESYRGAAIHSIDGAEIDELLDPKIQPSVVLMNPPFARSLG